MLSEPHAVQRDTECIKIRYFANGKVNQIAPDPSRWGRYSHFQTPFPTMPSAPRFSRDLHWRLLVTPPTIHIICIRIDHSNESTTNERANTVHCRQTATAATMCCYNVIHILHHRQTYKHTNRITYYFAITAKKLRLGLFYNQLRNVRS